VKKEDKERVVAELTERLRTTETLLVADYRGLTMPQIDDLRTKLLEHGARFAVVKNTLTRRAAEAVGSDTLLALLEGPTAIAFLESDGDPVGAARSARGDRVAREAAAGRHPARPGARSGHRSADGDRRPVHRPAAGPVRPARRADRTVGFRSDNH
jgi:Ribosomal protein L10